MPDRTHTLGIMAAILATRPKHHSTPSGIVVSYDTPANCARLAQRLLAQVESLEQPMLDNDE